MSKKVEYYVPGGAGEKVPPPPAELTKEAGENKDSSAAPVATSQSADTGTGSDTKKTDVQKSSSESKIVSTGFMGVLGKRINEMLTMAKERFLGDDYWIPTDPTEIVSMPRHVSLSLLTNFFRSRTFFYIRF